MKVTSATTDIEVFEVDLDFLKEEYARELAEWQLMYPGQPVTKWVEEVFREAGEGEGFKFLPDDSSYDYDVEVTE